MTNGGQLAVRGFLVQTLIALLDALDEERTWTTVTLEPNIDSEKVDILWEFSDGRKAVQVKSSQNPFNKSDVERWASELESWRQADEYELLLVGTPGSPSVAHLRRVGNVTVPPARNLDLRAFTEQAAQRLDRFLQNNNLPSGDADYREMLAGALTDRLVTLSTEGRRLTRSELVQLLSSWTRDGSLSQKQRILRYRTIAAVVVVAVLATASVSALAIHKYFRTAELERQKENALAEIDSVQVKLEERDQQMIIWLTLAAEAKGQSDVVARQMPTTETRKLADKLDTLVKSFREEFNAERLSEFDSQRLRRAEAKVALVQRRYRDALSLIKEEDTLTDMLTRADALFGLREWRDALKWYDAVQRVEPTRRTSVSLHRSYCLICLDRSAEATAELTEVVAHLERLVEREGRKDLVIALATMYNNRGVALCGQLKFDEGIEDFETGMEICRQQMKDHGPPEIVVFIAICYNNRGEALMRKGELEKGIHDLGKAIDMYTGEMKQISSIELAGDLARSYHNRSLALSDQNKLDECVKDLDKAAEILRKPAQNKRPDCVRDLAIVLRHRGRALSRLGRPSEGLRDFDESVAILTEAVAQGMGTELKREFAVSLYSRGIALSDQGRMNDGRTQFNESVAILTRLVDQEGRLEFAVDLARALRYRAKHSHRTRSLGEIVEDLEKAIVILERLVEHAERAELASELADSHNGCGFALTNQGKLDDAIKHLGRGIDIYTRLAEQEWHSEIAFELARTYDNRGVALCYQMKANDAIKDYDRAINILTRLIDEEGHEDMAGDLERVRRNRRLAAEENATRGNGERL